MGLPRDPQPVKLFAGFIFRDEKTVNAARSELSVRYGASDLESPVFPFIHTDYYDEEMGKPLYRKFVSFSTLIPPNTLSSVKLFTNSVEERHVSGTLRTINIDPGYLDLAKVVLASTKDFVHRIYIGRKIYAEVTLFYRNKSYCSWKWTYPDFRSRRYRDFFGQMRALYARQIKRQ